MSDDLKIRYTMQAVSPAILLVGVLTLAACATAPVYTSQDVALAAQQNQLELLFRQIQIDLAQVKPDTDEALALTTVLNDIGRRLAQPEQAVIDELQAEAAESPLSLMQIDQLQDAAQEVEEWQPERKQELRAMVDAARQQTGQQLEAVAAELETLPEAEAGRRNLLLREQAQLIGGKQAELLRRQAAEELDMLYRQGTDALDNKQLSKANELLQQVAIANPAYKNLVFEQEMVTTGLFEQRFWQALVESKPEQAYELFYQFSETAAFTTHRNKISKDASELADYFDALGTKQMRQKQWLESYNAFGRSAYIRSSLELSTAPASGMGSFIREMENRYKKAERAGQAEAALAYISIIERLQPQHPLVTSKRADALEAIHERAVAKVRVGRFLGAYGPQISSEIERYLSEAAPGEVRLVDEVEPQALLAEDSLAQAFLAIEGETLRAEVETREQARTETRTVVTATEEGANPLYRVWRELPRDERAQTEEPPKTAQLPVYQDVMVNHRDISNTAVLSLKYQLADAANSKVLEAETLSDTVTAKATATQGMQLGSFVQPPVAASLPAEAEMYNQLSKSLSTEIGRRVVTRLMELDRNYALSARKLEQDGAYAESTEQWAYAYAVSEPESDERARYRAAMEKSVLGHL
jgi:hypothetical protein